MNFHVRCFMLHTCHVFSTSLPRFIMLSDNAPHPHRQWADKWIVMVLICLLMMLKKINLNIIYLLIVLKQINFNMIYLISR